MSLTFDLGICTTSKDVPHVKEASDALLSFVAGAFSKGSAGDIVLQPRAVDGTKLANADLPTSVDSDMLHSALEAVTGRQRGQKQVTHIGILLAGLYEPRPGVFGYMFDDEFAPGSSSPGELTPREGCAVFLQAIANKRQGADFIQEVLFTGVHELGHVFNQQHSDPGSFMAISADRTSPFVVADCGFDDKERSLLHQCSSSRFIWPGGSLFGDLGDLAASPGKGADASNAPSVLRLTIATDRDSFWPFEPLELDVTLSYSGARKSYFAPDIIDPGYDAFAIWIEEPTGERRRYRSPRHYCEHTGRIRLTPDSPFRRDISIFGESGGYTFRRVGIHRVWVTLEVAAGRILRSNVVELDVRAPGRDDAYEACKHVLTTLEGAQLMYYRRLTRRRAAALADIEGVLEAFPRQSLSGMVHYAVGRSLAKLAISARADGSELSTGVDQAAKRHLRKAAASAVVGDHRRRHAELALDKLSSR